MDLRGIAKLSNNRWIICGGMDTNQIVSNRTFLLESNSLDYTPKSKSNFNVIYSSSGGGIVSENTTSFELIGITGRRVKTYDNAKSVFISNNEFPKGQYVILSDKGRELIELF
ncbi:MAG: hypothetical protein Crog4KO_11720 [Crocinitomicaceae bacterium]